MVLTEMSKVWRFLSGLCPGLAGLVDTGRDGLESYVDAIGRAIYHESWMKTEKKVNLSASEGLNKMKQSNPSQMYGNRQGGGRSGFQPKKPNNQDKSRGSGGKC